MVTKMPRAGGHSAARQDHPRRRVLMVAWSDLRFYPPVFNLGYVLKSHEAGVKVLGFKGRHSSSNSCRPHDISVHRVNSDARGLFGKIGCFLRMLAWLTRNCLGWRPTSIVAHGSQALILGAYAAFLSHAELIYYAHEVADKPPSSTWLRMAFHLETSLAKRCSAVACASPERAQVLAQRLRLHIRPLVVENSPPGDTGLCGCSVEPAVDFARRNTPEAEYIVVYAGRIGAAVGFAQICSAILALPEKYVLVAAGLVEEGFRREFEQSVAVPRILYYGTVPYPHLRRWLRGATVGLALYEPTDINTVHAAPCKMYEYLAAGIPVVTNSYPLALRTIAHNHLGVCVDTLSAAALAVAIKEVCETEEHAVVSEACSKFFRSRLAYEKHCDQLLATCLAGK